MKRVFSNLIITVIFVVFSACSSSRLVNCPSYSGSFGKEIHKTTKGINKNVFANGIKSTKRY